MISRRFLDTYTDTDTHTHTNTHTDTRHAHVAAPGHTPQHSLTHTHTHILHTPAYRDHGEVGKTAGRNNDERSIYVGIAAVPRFNEGRRRTARACGGCEWCVGVLCVCVCVYVWCVRLPLTLSKCGHAQAPRASVGADDAGDMVRARGRRGVGDGGGEGGEDKDEEGTEVVMGWHRRGAACDESRSMRIVGARRRRGEGRRKTV